MFFFYHWRKAHYRIKSSKLDPLCEETGSLLCGAVRGSRATACVLPCVCFYFESTEGLLSRLKSSRIWFPPHTHTHTHTHSKANDNTGHKCWQYWPTEEPGFQKLYETGHFYDFGLIPFTALYVKIYCMATLYFPITCINIRESAWRPVLFQHTDAIWHNTLKTIYKACQ